MAISPDQEHCFLTKQAKKLYSKAFRGMLPMFMVISVFSLPQPTILVGTRASNAVAREGVSTPSFNLVDPTTGLSRAAESDAPRNTALVRDRRTVSTLRNLAANTNVFLPTTVQGGCQYDTFPRESQLIPAGGQNGNIFRVKTDEGCKWKIQFLGDPGFIKKITILAPTLGGVATGPQDVSYDVGENDGSRREDDIEIVVDFETPTKHHVIQAGVPCSYQVSPALVTPPLTNQGGHRSLTVTAPTGCAWTINPNPLPSWIIPDDGSPLSDSGTKTFNYTVSPNSPGNPERSVRITVTGVGATTGSHLVVQPAGEDPPSPNCTYAVSPPFVAPPLTNQGGERSLNVTAPTGCPWTISTDPSSPQPLPSWIIPIDPLSDSGTKPFRYSVMPNPQGSPERTVSITVTGATNTLHVVRQPAGPSSNCTYAVSPAAAAPPLTDQGGNRSLIVTAPNGCPWTIIPNPLPPWITPLDPLSGSGTATFNYAVLPNPQGSPERSVSITVPGAPTPHVVTQPAGPAVPPGCTYALEPLTASFSPQGGDGSFAVTTTPSTGCPWTAVNNNPEFITITSGGSGSVNGTVNYSVAVNAGNASRTGTITVPGQTHSITQAGSEGVPGCTYEVKPTNALLGEGNGSFGFTVTTTPDTGCTWKAVTNHPEFITLVPPVTGNGRGTVIYSVPANAGASPLLGEIALEIGPEGKKGPTHRITQAAAGGCKDPQEKPAPEPIMIGQTIYGTLSTGAIRDCRSTRGSALLADRYEFILTQERKVAINVASADFDPFIILLKKIGDKEVMIDDDGAGFRSSRLPRLPAAEKFLRLEAGTYIVEVTTFATNTKGNYAALIASEDEPLAPAILAAITDGKTLIVIGENFVEGAKLFIGGSTKAEKDTTNDGSRSTTALIALKSAKKVKKGPITLRVVNPTGNSKESDIFVYPARP